MLNSLMDVTAAGGGTGIPGLHVTGDPGGIDEADRVQIADAVNATLIPLDDAPAGYADLDSGAARKDVLDPHGMVA